MVAGGCWQLIASSAAKRPNSLITSNTGSASLSVGHTRDVSALAIDQPAEIRHEIDALNQGLGRLHRKYVGVFTNPLPSIGSWTSLEGNSNPSLLDQNYERAYQPHSFGSTWYVSSSSGPLGATPSTPSIGFSGPSINSNPNQIVNSYRVWVRETNTPPIDPPDDPLGTSPSNPAYSAKQLLDAEPSSPSGFYWFDTDGPGGEAPFQAFADMTTDGGGWILAINSVIGSEAPNSLITSNTGSASLSVGHTRDVSALAIDQPAEIRHEIDALNQGLGRLHRKYVGVFTNPLPSIGSWTSLEGNSNPSLLDQNYERAYQPHSFGSTWYVSSSSGPLGATPSTPSIGFSGPSINSNPNQIVNSYRVWVRETNTPPPPIELGDASLAQNYELRGAGNDGLLGNGDDPIIPVTRSVDDHTVTLSFAALPRGLYRLTVRDEITDLNGEALDGDEDGLAGGDWVRDFFVGRPVPESLVLLTQLRDLSDQPLSGSRDFTLSLYDSSIGGSQLWNGTAAGVDVSSFVGGYLQLDLMDTDTPVSSVDPSDLYLEVEFDGSVSDQRIRLDGEAVTTTVGTSVLRNAVFSSANGKLENAPASLRMFGYLRNADDTQALGGFSWSVDLFDSQTGGSSLASFIGSGNVGDSIGGEFVIDLSFPSALEIVETGANVWAEVDINGSSLPLRLLIDGGSTTSVVGSQTVFGLHATRGFSLYSAIDYPAGQVNVRGFVRDSITEEAVIDSRTLSFALFDSKTGGTKIFEEIAPVEPDSVYGSFVHSIGSFDALDFDILNDFSELWLELSEGGQPSAGGRTRLYTAPSIHQFTASFDTTPPTVSDIRVGFYRLGNSDFLAYVDPELNLGYPIPESSPPLSWPFLNRWSVTFDEPVQKVGGGPLTASDISLYGVNETDYSGLIGNFAFDGTTAAVTLNSMKFIETDKLLVHIPGGSIADLSGNVLADDYSFRFDVVTGDANRSGAVLGSDVGQVRLKQFHEIDNGLPTAGYSIWHDLDGSGDILGSDVGLARLRQFNSLPAEEPVVPAAPIVANPPIFATAPLSGRTAFRPTTRLFEPVASSSTSHKEALLQLLSAPDEAEDEALAEGRATPLRSSAGSDTDSSDPALDRAFAYFPKLRGLR